MEIPLIRLGRVLHIGTMKPEWLGKGRGAGNSSLEGHSLSVSLCPNGWMEIARLGGFKVFELEHPDAVFVDVVALVANAELKAHVVDWARERGYVVARKMWQAWSYDDEVGDWRYSLAASVRDALRELDDGDGPKASAAEVPGPDGGPGIVPVMVEVGTKALAKLTGISCRRDWDAMDAAVMAWAMEAVPELLGHPVQGVWWRENYDPASLSAPRGGIFQSQVPQWTARPVELGGIDDDDELETMPETEWQPVQSMSMQP